MEIGIWYCIWNQWRPGLPSGLKSLKSQLALHPSLLASPLKVYQGTRNDSLVCLVRITVPVQSTRRYPVPVPS